MSQTESGAAAGEGGQRDAQRGRGDGLTLRRYVRRALDSGALAGVAGGASLLAGARALERDETRRGIVRLVLGSVLVTAAVRQRPFNRGRAGERASVDQTDVVESSADIEDAGPSPELDSDVEATGVDQTDVVDTGIDGADLAEAAGGADAVESETTGDAGSAEAESYERLGEAAFDEYSAEVPVPQRAFNQEFLSLDAEVFWGVREADDAVVVSGRYDPIDEGEGMRYVASSQVDDERMLSIPNAVRNHWDDVAGGGTAVASGDDIVFATSERLTAVGQLLVVPEGMVDDVLGEAE